MLGLHLIASLAIATGAPSAEPTNPQGAASSVETPKPKRKCTLVEVAGSGIPRRVCTTVRPKKTAEPAPIEEADASASSDPQTQTD